MGEHVPEPGSLDDLRTKIYALSAEMRIGADKLVDILRENALAQPKDCAARRWEQLGAASYRAGIEGTESPIQEKGGLGDSWRTGWKREWRRGFKKEGGQDGDIG